MREYTNQDLADARIEMGAEAQPGEIFKPKQHFFYAVLQDSTGKIIDIAHYTDYDAALMWGMEKAKEKQAFWTILDLNARFIDGNYGSK